MQLSFKFLASLSSQSVWTDFLKKRHGVSLKKRIDSWMAMPRLIPTCRIKSLCAYACGCFSLVIMLGSGHQVRKWVESTPWRNASTIVQMRDIDSTVVYYGYRSRSTSSFLSKAITYQRMNVAQKNSVNRIENKRQGLEIHESVSLGLHFLVVARMAIPKLIKKRPSLITPCQAIFS